MNKAQKNYMQQFQDPFKKSNFINDSQIDQNFKIMHPNLNLFPFELEALKTVFLKDNRQFQFLLSQLKAWNKEVINYKENNIKIFNPFLKNSIYKNLFELLREIVTNKDMKTQENSLKNVFEWFSKELNLNLNTRPKTSGENKKPQSKFIIEYPQNEENKNNFDKNFSTGTNFR